VGESFQEEWSWYPRQERGLRFFAVEGTGSADKGGSVSGEEKTNQTAGFTLDVIGSRRRGK